LAGECAAVEDAKERFEKSSKENFERMQLKIKQFKDQIEKLESQVSVDVVTVLPNY
jgi:hypothetical protein